ncbi:MAG: hypothetical protein PHN29_07270 [Endomicrobiaceae bacterium]|nr:hypothetical protein [Endomicrobiaceae bacterium]
MMKKLLILAVILSALTLLGLAFIKVIYPKYIDKPSNMIIKTSLLDFDWYQDQTFVPVKLTVFEAHDNAYYAFNPFEGKLRFINGEGVVVWGNDFYMQYNCSRNFFYNTNEGTIIYWNTGELRYYDKDGSLIWNKPAAFANFLPNHNYIRKDNSIFKKDQAIGKDEFYYCTVENYMVKYHIIDENAKEVFTYDSTELLTITKLNNDYYLVKSDSEFVILNRQGELIWRRNSPYNIVHYNFNGCILYVSNDNVVSVSYDGKETNILKGISNIFVNQSGADDYFYVQVTSGEQFFLKQYNRKFEEGISIGPFSNISAVSVNQNYFMFEGKNESGDYIYKYSKTGKKIIEYPSNGYHVLYFNDYFTIIKDQDNNIIGLNDDQSVAFTDGPYLGFSFYPIGKELLFVYNDSGHYIKKINQAGKTIFIKGIYNELNPLTVIITNKGNIVYKYSQNNSYYMVLDKDGNTIINDKLIGLDGSYELDRYSLYNIYVKDGELKTVIHFEEPLSIPMIP